MEQTATSLVREPSKPTFGLDHSGERTAIDPFAYQTLRKMTAAICAAQFWFARHGVCAIAAYRREGEERLSVKDVPHTPARHRKPKSADSGPDIGKALRTVYDETLREDVPSDFMDLLDKLH